jgi:hypothetical protein
MIFNNERGFIMRSFLLIVLLLNLFFAVRQAYGDDGDTTIEITTELTAEEMAEIAAYEKAMKEKAEKEKAKADSIATVKAELEKAEAIRLANLKAAEEKAAQDKAAADKLALEKAEQERLAKLKLEQEAAEKEKAKADSIATVKAELEKAEAIRLANLKAAEEKAAQDKAAADKLALEKAEQERLAKLKLEQEAALKEKAKADPLLAGIELEEDAPPVIQDVTPVKAEEPVPAVEPSAPVTPPVPVHVETEAERIERLTGLIQNIFDGKNSKMDDIIAGDDPELNGYISNIQAAPFDNNLLSFEVTVPDDKAIKLVLYNIESQFLIQVSAVENYEQAVRMMPYPVMDRGANWHPDKNYMVFYSNGFENRDQLYIAQITDPHLTDAAAVKVSRLELTEEKGTINFCSYPDFNSSGEDIFFTLKIEKESKKQKYSDDMNIAVVRNVFQYKEADFKNAKYSMCISKKLDQLKPICSPIVPYIFAFCSYKKEMTPGRGYAQYELVVYNMKDKTATTVDDMSGFTDYPYQWDPSGRFLYFCKALPLPKTPQGLRDKRTNIINLQVAEITAGETEINSQILKNSNSEVIMGDVATKDNGIGFFGDNLVFMGKYDPYESIFMVDMKKWMANDGFYAKQLPIDLDNDFPVLTKDSFLFLRYEWFEKTQTTVSTIARIFYEPKVDEEAERVKKERREKKKNKKK